MRLNLSIESRRHPQPQVEVEREAPIASRQPAALRVIEDAWKKASSAPPTTQPGLMQWVGGAIVAYATLLDLDPEAVRSDLLDRFPPPSRQPQEFYGDGTSPFVVEPPDPNRPKRRQSVVPPEELDSIVDGEATS